MNPRYREPWGESCPWPREDDAEDAPRQGPKPRGADWAERNPEAAAHEAQRNRLRIIENAAGKGGRL